MDRPVVNGFKRIAAWDAAKAPNVIDEVEKEALSRADWYINWYQVNKKIKSRWSKFIRLSCIVLFLMTALIPVLHTLPSITPQILNYGYILAGIGSGLLFLDKFYGFSSGWIRYNNTLASIGNAKRDFQKLMQDAVLVHPPATVDGFVALIDTIRTFDDNISAIIQTEADEWSKEFQAGNQELQSFFKQQTDQQKPGDLQVNVTPYSTFKNIELLINGQTKGPISGGTRLLNALPPDNYSLTVKATLENDTPVIKSAVAAVKAGVLTIADVKFA